MPESNQSGPNVIIRQDKPRILLCTSEVTELPGSMGNAANLISYKAGGLADISAALVKHLNNNSDYEFHAVLPKFDESMKYLGQISQQETHQIKMALKEQNVHLIDHSAFSETFFDGKKVNIYGDDEYHSASKKALAYQAGVINYVLTEVNPHLIHCNDWMTGLIPAAARDRGIKSLFTLHNIFTNKVSPLEIHMEGINAKRLNGNLFFENHPDYMEDNFSENIVDMTTTGIFSSDYFNTVSRAFLEEIVSGEFPERIPAQMRDQIRAMYYAGRAEGIINAPRDEDSPEDSHFITPYDTTNFIEGKRENKVEFQKEMGLKTDPDTPLFLWPHRLDEQKGIEELMPYIDYLVSNFGIQIAFVGDGREEYESALGEISLESGGMVAYSSFSGYLEDLGLAASDFLLMPSNYEPCGLPQMKAKRYGTVPVVRNTGGLSDTVEPLDAYNDKGSGIVFDVADREGLDYAIRSCLEGFYNIPLELKYNNQKRIMEEGAERHNLKNTAEQYLRIYEILAYEARND